jgi:hypothetical protein
MGAKGAVEIIFRGKDVEANTIKYTDRYDRPISFQDCHVVKEYVRVAHALSYPFPPHLSFPKISSSVL